MPISFSNLIIENIIVHEIFTKNSDGTNREPNCSNALTELDAESIQILQSRVLQGIGKDAQCYEMDIVQDSDTSVFHYIFSTLSDAATFKENSIRIVNKLNDAQHSRNIPGGLVLEFTGKIGTPSKNIFGIIKAEMQSGFDKEERDHQIIIKLIKSLILTPAQKLYKIGIFIENNVDTVNKNKDNYTVFVYDSNLHRQELTNAANYFYNTFLGCQYKPTDRKMTTDFYYKTNAFIKGLEVNEETKLDYQTSLYSYLKLNRREQLRLREFAEEYLDADIIDGYVDYMVVQGFTEQAFHKDTSMLKSELKRRTYKFSTKVKILVPIEEGGDELVIIGDIDDEGFTNVKIKGDVEAI